MNWIGIIQIVLIIAATGVSARDSQATRAAGVPALAARCTGKRLARGKLAGRLDTGRLNTGRLDPGRLDTGRLDTGRLHAGRLDTGRLDWDVSGHGLARSQPHAVNGVGR
jgi:hypothetical protein